MLCNSRKVSALLMAGLIGFGGMAAPLAMRLATPVSAYADDGSVTITQSHNTNATYDGYRLFKANVDANDNATNVAWENDTIKTNVLAYLDAHGYGDWLTANGHLSAVGGIPAHDIAQNAAGFIAEKIRDSTKDTQAGTTPDTTKGDSFANHLARDLAAKGVAKVTQDLASGTAFTGAQGYYLFVTHKDSIGTDEAGTAPIWIAIGATAKTILEKSAIPTVAKTVKEDSTDTFGDVADANRGQSLEYKLVGTVAGNANAYPTYFCEFVDTMAGLEMSASEVAGITVLLDESDITDALKVQEGSSIAYTNGRLTVTIADLLALGTVGAGSTVTVNYKAHLGANAIIGGAGNANTVVLNYSSDPTTASHASTSPGEAKTYSYALGLTKVDQDTREALQGAKFTIQVADSSTDTASKGMYVQADGSLAVTAYEFVTGADGTFVVQGIDEGVYTVHETEAPSGHKAFASDITLTVSRTHDSAGALTGLAATVSGGNGLFVDNPQANQDGVVGASTATGRVNLVASNKKETYLPGTGLTTSSAGMICGFVLLTGGLVGVTRYRKEDMGDAA